MKKSVGFFWVMICVLELVGCGTTNNAEKAENKISQPIVEESIISRESDVEEVKQDESEVEKFNFGGDLLYREYSWGHFLEADSEVIIERDAINQVSDSINTICIILDGVIYKEITYDDTDIEFLLTEGGNYGFLALDNEKNLLDIMSIVKVQQSADGGVIFLDD